MSKPTIINDNYGTLRIKIRETAVKAASRVYREYAPCTDDHIQNVVKLARELEKFMLELDDGGNE